MENRDKDKLSQGSSISQDKSKSDMNEPISRKSGSVGDSGMKGGSSDLDKSSDLGSSDISSDKEKSSTWSDKGRQ